MAFLVIGSKRQDDDYNIVAALNNDLPQLSDYTEKTIYGQLENYQKGFPEYEFAVCELDEFHTVMDGEDMLEAIAAWEKKQALKNYAPPPFKPMLKANWEFTLRLPACPFCMAEDIDLTEYNGFLDEHPDLEPLCTSKHEVVTCPKCHSNMNVEITND